MVKKKFPLDFPLNQPIEFLNVSGWQLQRAL